MQHPFSIPELLKIVRQLERDGGRPARSAAFRQELADLIAGMGLEASDAPWAEERSAGDHNRQLKADATAFNKIAASDSPLDAANLLQERVIRSRFYSVLRGWYIRAQRRHPVGLGLRHLTEVPWAELVELTADDHEPADAYVRRQARELARDSLAHVTRGRPTDHRIDTLLHQLAILYARYTGYRLDHNGLPHSVESRFIKFAHPIIHKCFPFQATHTSLAARWKRSKKYPDLDLDRQSHKKTGKRSRKPMSRAKT